MDYIDIFQNLAFPIAVCCVLFGIMVYFGKKCIGIITDMMKRSETERQAYTDYLQRSNAELVSTIKENTRAFLFCYVLIAVVDEEIADRFRVRYLYVEDFFTRENTPLESVVAVRLGVVPCAERNDAVAFVGDDITLCVGN